MDNLEKALKSHAYCMEQVFNYKLTIANLIRDIEEAVQGSQKILVCGNGGSAADSQHFVAELVVKFKRFRKALPAVSLTTDTSVITAIGNDFGYDQVFSRQVEALGQSGDILVVISTSGNSINCIKAVEVAKKVGMTVYGFLGKDGGKLKELVDYPIIIDHAETARIQEAHEFIYHFVCDELDNKSTFTIDKD